MSGADLANATLAAADIESAQLSGANLSGASLSSTTGAPASVPVDWSATGGTLTQVPSAVRSGTTFSQGQWIESPNGEFTVNMQSDGNLVEYQEGTAIWATGTSGAVTTVMQTDCNLVIYKSSGVGQPAAALYTTGTGGDPTGNCSFAVAADGTLSVTTSEGTIRWARYPNGTLFTIGSR